MELSLKENIALLISETNFRDPILKLGLVKQIQKRVATELTANLRKSVPVMYKKTTNMTLYSIKLLKMNPV
jgi:hypothetical protein